MKRSASAVAFPVVAFVVAAATSALHGSMEVANAALVLAVVIVIAGTIDWVAGLSTAIVGAGSLNYFHTEPVHSLRITATSDLVSVLLLVALGGIVAAATAIRVTERVRRYHASLSRSARLAVNRSQPATAMWHAAIDAESAALAQFSSRLVPAGSERLPVVARHAGGPDDESSARGSVTIPATGAVVVLRDPRLGVDLVLSPRATGSSSEVLRSTVFMLADSVELCLSHGNQTDGKLAG